MIRRGLRIAVVAFALLVVVVLAVAVVVWQTRRPALAVRLESLVQSYLIDNDSTRIEIGGVSGNPLGALKLHDVSLLVRDGSKWKTFLTAASVEVDFSLTKLSRRGVELEAVAVESPLVSVERGESGKHLWPHFKEKGSRTGPGFTIYVKHLGLRRGLFKIDRRKDDILFSDIDLETSLKRDTSGVIALNGLTASFTTLPWDYRVDKLGGNVFLEGSSVGSDSLGVVTPSSSYAVKGRYAFGEKRDVALELLIDTLSLKEMRRFEQLGFLPSEGALSGRADVTKKDKGPTKIDCGLAGAYGKHPVESLEASAELGRGRWQTGFRLLSGGSVVEGTFSSGPDTLQICAVDFKGFNPGDWPELFGQEKIPHGSLDGGFRFAGKSLTSDERRGEFEVALDGGNYAGFSFLRANGKGEFDGQGGLTFPGVTVQGAGYTANVEGAVGAKGAIHFDFDGTVKKLAEFSWVRGSFDLAGNLTVSGKLDGDGEKLLLDAAVYGPLAGTSPRIVSGTMRAGSVKGQLWPAVSLETSTGFAPASLFGVAVDSVEARAMILEGTEGAGGAGGAEPSVGTAARPDKMLITATFKAFKADTTLAADASVRVGSGTAQTAVTKLAVDAGGTRWTNPNPFRLDWEKGTLSVSELRLTSQAGSLSLEGSFEPEAKRSSGTLEVDLAEVSTVAGRFAPVTGKLKGRIEAGQDKGATTLDVSFEWRDGSLSGRRFDGLSFSAAADAGQIDVRQVVLEKGRGRVDGSGKLTLPSGLVGLADTLSARRSLPSGTSADFDLNVRGFELGGLADWHPSLDSLGGTLDGTIHVEGPLEEPRIGIVAAGRDVHIRQYEVSGVDAAAGLAGGVCTISRLELTERNAKGTVGGSFPLNVDLCRGRVGVPDGPLNLDVQLSESDFAVASLFIKQIASASGLIQGSVKMRGTVKDPDMDGAFQITNATLRLAGREEVLEHLDAEVKLDEKAVQLVRFSATQGQDGELDGSGRIQIGQPMRGQYSFALKGRKITVGDPEDMAMKFDCDLVISSVEVPEEGTLPKITGRIDLRQGIVAREFSGDVASGGGAKWLCDVELEVPNNLWLKNINTEVELAGSLTARKETGGMILLGTLTILRGKYYVFDNEFRIVSGTLDFKDVGRIDPELNIQAQTTASGREILLTLTGKLSEPNIQFTSADENLTQTDVLRLLTLGKYVEGTPGQTTETGLVPGVTGTVGNYFLRQIERRLARELKWVDSIELGGSLEGGGSLTELRWGLGKYVTPELYLRYSQGLVRPGGRDVSIEYRLSKLLFLRGGVASKDRLTGRDKDEYTLDLRLKYEY